MIDGKKTKKQLHGMFSSKTSNHSAHPLEILKVKNY